MAKRKKTSIGALQNKIARVSAEEKKVKQAHNAIKKKAELEKRLQHKLNALQRAKKALAGVRKHSRKRK